MFTFQKPSLTGASCQAYFFTWAQLSEMCSALLTALFGHSTPAQAVGETNCDSWSLKLLETPLSREALEVIFTALQADDYERDVNDFGEYPVWELSQSLGRKLVSPMLPFVVEASHAADDGVWFTGNKAMYAVTVIRQRQEGRNNELYYSTFLIAQDRLPEPSEAACEAYLRKVICDFLQTEAGKRAYEDTCEDFNWGDVEAEIPDEFFAAYGVTLCSSGSDADKFLCCGTTGILVNQDELLGEFICDEEAANG